MVYGWNHGIWKDQDGVIKAESTIITHKVHSQECALCRSWLGTTLEDF